MIQKAKSKSQKAIEQAGRKLFWKFGIRKVTVEELCEEAGISKMTFYRNFDNKEDLATRILEDMTREGIQRYDSVMQSELPFPEKISQIIANKMEVSQGLSEELLKDLLGNHFPQLQQNLAAIQQEAMQKFVQDLEKAKAEGYIRKDAHIPAVIYAMQNSSQQLMQDPNYLALFPSAEAAQQETIHQFFYGLAPKSRSDA